MPEKIDHDQIFKNLLKNFFKEFMELFFPDEAKAINFRRITYLDKEYFTDTSGGKRKQLDLVAKVGLKGGGEEYILIHTEFQASKDMAFAQRMFEYYAQLFLRYRKPIIPIALFADDATWRKPVPDVYKVGFRKEVYVHFKYHRLKLKDMDYRRFLRSDNPLAYALMAKMGFDKRQRVQFKADFLRLILRAKINSARKSILIDFVENYIRLNKTEERKLLKLVEEKKEYKEVQKMITTYEEKGMEKGLLEGKQEALLLLLKSRFGFIDNAVEDKIMHLSSTAKVDKLLKKAAIVDDFKDLKI